MTWFATLTVKDCATGKEIPFVVVSGGDDVQPAAGSTGKFLATFDDANTRYKVQVQAPGYVSDTFIFERGQDGSGGDHEMCLTKQNVISHPPAVVQPPRNLRSHLRWGEFTVEWDADPCDHFNVVSAPVSVFGLGKQVEVEGAERSFVQTHTRAETYRFTIQRCKKELLMPSNCSSIVSLEVKVPPALAFQPWRPWFQIHPETVFDHTKQSVVSLASTPGHVDLFVIGFDNVVWSTFWDASGGWRPWFQIHPETVFDQTKQQVVALAPAPGHVDLFVIGFDNAVWSTFWDASGGWRPWFQIHPETVFDRGTQRVFALATTPGHVDLFVIGFDNAVWSTFWDANGGWRPWFQIHPETIFDHTKQRVVALATAPGHVDLFVIGFDNAVWSTFWEAGGGWRPWFQIHPKTVFDHTKQQVVALASVPGHVDLFVIGFDNAVWSTFWEAGGGWRPWFQIHPETVFDQNAQRVAASARTPGHADLFVVGFDNAVWSSWWSAD